MFKGFNLNGWKCEVLLFSQDCSELYSSFIEVHLSLLKFIEVK